MKKLLCINAGWIREAKTSANHFLRVEKDIVYTTDKESFIDDKGDEVYYILETRNNKLKERFKELND